MEAESFSLPFFFSSTKLKIQSDQSKVAVLTF